MLEKSIRAIQFIAKPAVKLTTTLAKKVAEQAVPRTVEFTKTWQREWDKDASSIKPTIIQPQPKPTSSSEDIGDVGICRFCEGPYIDGHCQEYKCWK
jgi:hypothetical protein